MIVICSQFLPDNDHDDDDGGDDDDDDNCEDFEFNIVDGVVVFHARSRPSRSRVCCTTLLC